VDLLQKVLFESPIWLGALSFLVFAVVLLAQRRLTGPAARYSLPVTLAVIALLFLVQSLVTTQRERILEALNMLVTAVEQKDLDDVRGLISPRYEAEGEDQDAIVAEIADWLQAISIRDTRLTRREMILGARATISIRGGVGEFHFGRWRISWRREPDGWMIGSLHPEMIDGRPIGSMGRLRDYAP
jgi:hypothetical protein